MSAKHFLNVNNDYINRIMVHAKNAPKLLLRNYILLYDAGLEGYQGNLESYPNRITNFTGNSIDDVLSGIYENVVYYDKEKNFKAKDVYAGTLSNDKTITDGTLFKMNEVLSVIVSNPKYSQTLYSTDGEVTTNGNTYTSTGTFKPVTTDTLSQNPITIDKFNDISLTGVTYNSSQVEGENNEIITVGKFTIDLRTNAYDKSFNANRIIIFGVGTDDNGKTDHTNTQIFAEILFRTPKKAQYASGNYVELQIKFDFTNAENPTFIVHEPWTQVLADRPTLKYHGNVIVGPAAVGDNNNKWINLGKLHVYKTGEDHDNLPLIFGQNLNGYNHFSVDINSKNFDIKHVLGSLFLRRRSDDTITFNAPTNSVVVGLEHKIEDKNSDLTIFGISNHTKNAYNDVIFGRNNRIERDSNPNTATETGKEFQLNTILGISNSITFRASNATVVGYSNHVEGVSSNATAIGADNIISFHNTGIGGPMGGEKATTVGLQNQIRATRGLALGFANSVKFSNGGIAVGNFNNVTTNENGSFTYHDTGEYSSAFGAFNKASGDRSNAIGYSNTTAGENSTTIGILNSESGTTNYIFGFQNYTTANQSILIGRLNNYTENFDNNYASTFEQASYPANNSLAVGVLNQVVRSSSSKNEEGQMAFGWANKVSGNNALTVGRGNTGSATNSSAVGHNNNAGGYFYPSAFGCLNAASGDYSSAFGGRNTASGDYSSAFGYYNKENESSDTSVNIKPHLNSKQFGNSVLFGNENNLYFYKEIEKIDGNPTEYHVQNTQNAIFGISNLSSGWNNVVIGINNNKGRSSVGDIHSGDKYGLNSVIVGSSCNMAGQHSVAIGNGALTAGDYSIAIGHLVYANSHRSILIGSDIGSSSESATRVIRLGNFLSGSGFNTLHIGEYMNNDGTSSIAIGGPPKKTNNHPARATISTDSILIGRCAPAVTTGKQSVTIGNSALAVGENSIAIGFGAKAPKANTIAIGNGAETSFNIRINIGNMIKYELIGTGTDDYVLHLPLMRSNRYGFIYDKLQEEQKTYSLIQLGWEQSFSVYEIFKSLSFSDERIKSMVNDVYNWEEITKSLHFVVTT